MSRYSIVLNKVEIMEKAQATKEICNCLPICFSYEGNYMLILNDCPVHKGHLLHCQCEPTHKGSSKGNYYLVRFDCPVHQGTLNKAHARIERYFMVSLSNLIRNIFSFTVPVKQKLMDLNKAIEENKLSPQQILMKTKGVVSLSETAVNYQNQYYMKYKDSIVPANLIPESFHGTPTIGNMLKEAMDLFKNLKAQSQDVGQIKFISETIKKLVPYFDAVTETAKKIK